MKHETTNDAVISRGTRLAHAFAYMLGTNLSYHTFSDGKGNIERKYMENVSGDAHIFVSNSLSKKYSGVFLELVDYFAKKNEIGRIVSLNEETNGDLKYILRRHKVKPSKLITLLHDDDVDGKYQSSPSLILTDKISVVQENIPDNDEIPTWKPREDLRFISWNYEKEKDLRQLYDAVHNDVLRSNVEYEGHFQKCMTNLSILLNYIDYKKTFLV